MVVSESLIFTISQGIVDSVVKRTDESEPLDYIGQTLARMLAEQPELYSSIQYVGQRQLAPPSYLAGAVVAFDAIIAQLELINRKVEITSQDLEVHKQNLFEHLEDTRWQDLRWAEEQLQEGKRPVTNPSWFMEELSRSSPGFMAFLVEIMDGFGEDVEMKRSFLRGVIDVAMPFWGKIEAGKDDFWLP